MPVRRAVPERTRAAGAGQHYREPGLTNLGSLPARETVQLYLRDCCASISRPVMELKGIQKAEIAPKESRRVEL